MCKAKNCQQFCNQQIHANICKILLNRKTELKIQNYNFYRLTNIVSTICIALETFVQIVRCLCLISVSDTFASGAYKRQRASQQNQSKLRYFSTIQVFKFISKMKFFLAVFCAVLLVQVNFILLKTCRRFFVNF